MVFNTNSMDANGQTNVNGTVNFTAGATSETFVINTSATPGDIGNKIFSVTITNPQSANPASSSNPTGDIPAVAGGPSSSIVILDPNTLSTQSSNAEFGSNTTGENATVTTSGVGQQGVNQNATTNFVDIGGTAAGSNGYAAFAVADYNDFGSDPSDFYYPGNSDSNSFTTPANAMRTIDGIELETVGAPQSANTSGPLNVYVVANTTASITALAASGGLTFLPTTDPGNGVFDATGQGVGNQLGNKYLLGTINYVAGQPTLTYTPYKLTNLDPTGLSLLQTAIDTNSKFRIVIAPGNSTVDATFLGWNSNITDEAPILRFNYTANPTVTALNPSTGPLAGETPVTITAFSGRSAIGRHLFGANAP